MPSPTGSDAAGPSTLGLALCAAASVAGALAQTSPQVIAARGDMGAGAALLMPATLSILAALFPEPHLRRKAIALWAVVGSAGGLTGPVIGGWLVQHSSWRAGFWINPPIAAATIALTLLVVPESRTPRYVLRGPARGPLASGPGMTVPPCRRDDLGGGVTGPEGCCRRR
ncbi:MFS transporter [Streptomyces violascens]|uniref:MFS transporter n=1 Tax=Streptomyces violascens TaxID=67381 RepID=UPI0036617231